MLRPTFGAINFETLGLERVESDEKGIKWLAVARLQPLPRTLPAALWNEASPRAVAEPLRYLYTACAVYDWVRIRTEREKSAWARARALNRMPIQSPLEHRPEAHNLPLDRVDEAIRTAQDPFDIEGDRDAPEGASGPRLQRRHASVTAKAASGAVGVDSTDPTRRHGEGRAVDDSSALAQWFPLLQRAAAGDRAYRRG